MSASRAGQGRPSGVGSTAAVLWLMILLVFLPIVAAHGVALLFEETAPAAKAPG